MFGRVHFWHELFNTLVMALSVPFGQIIIGLAGLGFARSRFRGRDCCSCWSWGTMTVPFEILYVPILSMPSEQPALRVARPVEAS